MNKIKKIFLTLTLMSLASGFIFAQNELPSFDGNGFVIDADAVEGKFKSHLIVINKNDASPLNVKVFAYEKNDWKEIDTAVFNFFDDELNIKPSKDIKPSDYRFFAIELNKDVKASYKAEKNHNDLVIEIRNEGSDLTKPAIPTYTGNPKAFIFDLYSVEDGEDADENMKLKGKFPTKSRTGFWVFAYDKRTHEWIEFGTSYIERKNDTDSVEGKNNDLGKYRYFAIESMDGTEYNYEPEEDDDDLIVTVTLP
ncbi:hypothetical protein [Treponema bryantii]|uniref:hypothetical protein n=1 Tax=Treponema bryantii TaxID=163 RepID=UPI0003B3F782|nr:hypothetical protein [Treponema bryantii]